MNVAVLAPDQPAGAIVKALLARLDVTAYIYTARPHRPPTDDFVATLRATFDDVVWIDPPARQVAARPLAIAPSLAAWLTRDPEANHAVLDTREVPAPADAEAWLRALRIGGRAFSVVLDGVELAERLELGVLAGFAPDFRALVAALRPGWGGEPRFALGPGRPPGVALFRGTGYALCLELLERGAGAEVTPAMLTAALGRTKTPILRYLGEGRRRGYLQRKSARGALVVRDTARLLDDVVTSVRADRLEHRLVTRSLRADRDPAGLPARVGRFLEERGRGLAITGATAVADLGGDQLHGAPVYAYASTTGLDGPIADAHVDARSPSLVLIEPPDDAVLHGRRRGPPDRVAIWQAVIDLLASNSERERDIGVQVRRRLEHG